VGGDLRRRRRVPRRATSQRAVGGGVSGRSAHSSEQLFASGFGGAFRVRARFEPSDWQIAEVEYEKSKEAPMTKAYQELRDAGYTYEEMAEANLQAMIRWKLGPVVDPAARRDTLLRYAEWLDAAATEDRPNIDAGSPYSRMMAFAVRDTQAKHLLERYPALRARGAEFAASDSLRHMPTLASPAALRAAIATIPNRQARPSDGYDINHLTRGLSRCDVVTADGGMTELCRVAGSSQTAATCSATASWTACPSRSWRTFGGWGRTGPKPHGWAGPSAQATNART
jgi:hypothetical protein